MTAQLIPTLDRREHDPTSGYLAWLERLDQHDPERFWDAWHYGLLALVALGDKCGIDLPVLREAAKEIAVDWIKVLPFLDEPERGAWLEVIAAVFAAPREAAS